MLPLWTCSLLSFNRQLVTDNPTKSYTKRAEIALGAKF